MDPKTTGLKLSELHPCDVCGGVIAPLFYVVEVKLAALGQEAREVIGTAAILGGIQKPGALAIAECLAPDAEHAVRVSETLHKLFICNRCYCNGPIDIPVLVEKQEAARERAEAEAEARRNPPPKPEPIVPRRRINLGASE